jgi:protein ImuB
MQHWYAAEPAPAGSRQGAQHYALCDADAGLYPAWLCENPQPLQTDAHGAPRFHGPLALLAGPQRIEEAGWDDAPGVQRDYFIARSAASGLLWVFRQRLQRSGPGAAAWFLHGMFA